MNIKISKQAKILAITTVVLNVFLVAVAGINHILFEANNCFVDLRFFSKFYALSISFLILSLLLYSVISLFRLSLIQTVMLLFVAGFNFALLMFSRALYTCIVLS